MTCFDPRILVLGSGVLIPMSDLTLLLKNEVFSGMCERDYHEDAARSSMFVLKSDVTSLHVCLVCGNISSHQEIFGQHHLERFAHSAESLLKSAVISPCRVAR